MKYFTVGLLCALVIGLLLSVRTWEKQIASRQRQAFDQLGTDK